MLRSSDDDSDICFQGRETAYILCDEFFQIYKNFTKLRMLQATDAFPRARCIQDAVDKGVRGNVVPRPAPLSFLWPERASQGNPVPLNKEDFLDGGNSVPPDRDKLSDGENPLPLDNKEFLDGGNPLPLNKEDFLDDGDPVPPDRDELSGIFYFCCPFKNPQQICGLLGFLFLLFKGG